MNFEPVIGIEIHVELKTKSKMFSSGPVTFGNMPNTETVLFDWAFPGTMPVVNKEAVKYGIKIANALNMSVSKTLYFDRKNYFYSDLPKGYQITQQDHPIGYEGFLEIETSNVKRKIGIERAHLEEDTAKQLHFGDMSLVDYNRAGTPLVEIVSKPDIRSGEEASKYVEGIREIVTYLGVSDGKMEEGSLRCDVNISIRPVGSEKLGTKVEIKNLNSIANVKAAIDYEVERQAELILSGGVVEQETRRYNETQKKTELMRKKTNAVDYKYFREPNIVPIDLSDEFIESTIKSMSKLPSAYRAELQELGLSKYEVDELLRDKKYVLYFVDCLSHNVKNIKTLWNYLMVDVLSYLNKDEVGIESLKFTSKSLVSLINMLADGKINSKQAKEVLAVMYESGEDAQVIVDRLGLSQVSDDSAILEIVKTVLANNAQSISDFKAGKDRALGYLVGQVMKASQGKANPSKAKEFILKEIA